MSVQFTTLKGCNKNASERQTIYAASEIMLFKSALIPTPSTTLAEFEAAEADYASYARMVLTAWFAPGLAPGSGWLIGSPLVQFAWAAAGLNVGNVIGGAVLIDAAGDDRIAVIFTEPVPMQGAGNIIPINLVDLFPTGY